MSEQQSQAIFQIVDRVGERPWRQSVVALQIGAKTENGVRVTNEETVMLVPNQLGQYNIRADHPHYKACVTAMKKKQQAENIEGQPPRIIGPFADNAEAAKALASAAPRSPEELLAIERVKLQSLETTNSELKQKIAELTAKGSK